MGDKLGLRLTLPGIATPAMRGDNLAISLASFFEPGIESDEMDDSGTWKQGAIDASDEVIDAIHAHYAPTIATLTAERDALRAQVEAMRVELVDIAESDDIENCLDPQRNKRVARATLAKLTGPPDGQR